MRSISRLRTLSSLSLALTLVASGTLRVAYARAGSKNPYFPAPVYVALQGSGAVAVIPGKMIWKGFPQAHYLALGPKGKWLIVSGFSTGNVYLANTVTHKKVATLHIGSLVQGVKIDPKGRYALASDASGGSVAVINLDSRKVVKSIPVGKAPHNIVFSHDGRTAYVTVQGAGKLAVIDMKTLKLAREISIPGMLGPHNLDLNAAGTRLWIRSHSAPGRDGSVAVVNLATGKVEHHFKVGPFHGGITTMPRGRYVACTNIGSDTVNVFDANHPKPVKTIRVGQGPHGIRPGPDGHWLYVGSTQDATLDVINLNTFKVVDHIKLPKGSFPFWIAVPGHS